jgi:hypothetical protein
MEKLEQGKGNEMCEKDGHTILVGYP